MDSSNDIEVLNSASEASDDYEHAPIPQSALHNQRVQQEYRFLQKFASAEESEIWWEDHSKGWKRKSDRSVASGDQIVTYR
jgi:hypothetical protein